MIYEGTAEATPWSGFLEVLRGMLDANYVTMILRPPSPEHSWQVVFAGEAKPEIAETYNSFFYVVDPFVNLPVGRVMTIEEVVNEEEWLRSAIYQEFLSLLEVRYYLGVDLGDGGEPFCRLRISRAERSLNFGDAERAICQILLPHIRCAVRLRNQVDVTESERQFYAGTLERLSVGAVILDKRGKILRSNGAATEILRERDGLSIANGGLHAALGSENRELQTMIEHAIRGETSPRPHLVSGMSLTRPSGRQNLGIVVKAAPMTAWSESAESPAGVVIIRDVEQKSVASQAVLKRLYGLTPAEATLALKLLEGMTVDEASEQLHISRNTARCQLRAIFDKTGVARQSELVRLLLSGVAPLVH
ncbi:MAG: helix-turn-helix transcriptional regulator [Proteobacteria bacterium]|nr:helix-turn-helix transcriptional regulator [Pseudomonadota bacterium]MBS0611038.1 helix-turn-helix transcriptional regulator [Pseudomonadota bacterium]